MSSIVFHFNQNHLLFTHLLMTKMSNTFPNHSSLKKQTDNFKRCFNLRSCSLSTQQIRIKTKEKLGRHIFLKEDAQEKILQMILMIIEMTTRLSPWSFDSSLEGVKSKCVKFRYMTRQVVIMLCYQETVYHWVATCN